ncbi:histidine triad nucleotide-binding protein [Tuwongella immobilis]|uniref:HIT domain-containing protein n=1 Tax=Tuwongella immobilis TaxID=692036 RepID=A0A6C2YK52_9BACT|nr:histidine triad nucleotide-binding protein [Tuwongella immobilis]VIP01806.1 histidine triad protein : Histidine triad nucleotide-binding protein 1 OS=Wohlfahrtiimonas chitiniclastica SH04 GN=F387_00307 PE=4 SV=1: HIT [Tuwongella immobilis]VTR99507.1 histidine triad protein : Histidine triad nucleotide-binding protein 1 OS=Wohlfahrtiimonas chitiniclastica SH04 GN=F387_00307 PE=4 SV=1: HIT [Tuwongella immobilis]
MLSTNIFLKVIDRSIPAQIVFEDDLVLAFRDIHPQAPTHILIIPKKEIPTHDDLTEADQAILGRMHWAANQIAKQLNLTDGYRLVINCKDSGGQTVPHLHMHLLGGRNLGWPPG